MKQFHAKILNLNVFGSPFYPNKILRTLLQTKVRDRLRIIASEVERIEIDFFVVQEIHTYFHFQILRKFLQKSLPYVSYKPFLYGPKGGLAIFSRFELKDTQYVDFSKRGVLWNKSITGPLTRKGILITRLKNYSCALINTHLTQNSDHVWTDDNRFAIFLESQLQDVTKAVMSYKKNLTLVMGDFNMPKDSSFYLKFLKNSRLEDVFSTYSSSTYHNDLVPHEIPVGRVDYIFHTGNLRVLKKEHQFREKVELPSGKRTYISDHIGLYVEIAERQ